MNMEEEKQQNTTLDRYRATMILASVGDTLGYKNGDWEFNRSGKRILKQFNEITNDQGMKNMKLDSENWSYSDDTVMHKATALGLINDKGEPENKTFDLDRIMTEIAKQYLYCWNDMPGRGPGIQCGMGVDRLYQGKKWNQLIFSRSGGGCGGSMRSACIGLCYKYPQELDKIVAISIESCRITHHHPTGYFGSLTSSLFTALAFNNIDITKWPAILLNEAIPLAKKHINDMQRQVCENEENMNYFINHWEEYIKLRKLPEKADQPASQPVFPENYDLQARQQFYTKISWDGWGGASGHDSVIIAYDAFLSSKQDWNELCIRSALHGGDSDSTATIACAWYGALKGFQGVYEQNYNSIEGIEELEELGKQLYKLFGQQN